MYLTCALQDHALANANDYELQQVIVAALSQAGEFARFLGPRKQGSPL